MDALGTTALWIGSAFAAGALNAMAGGGSFLTFPALVFSGVPPIMANATSAVAVSPGYLGSTLGFKSELAELPRRRLWQEASIAAMGGVLGALLLLVTPAKLFNGLVPWLLLFATGLFLLGPYLAQRHGGGSRWRNAGLLAVAIYGGYFNGGLGILLMALYAVTGEASIHTSNALKNLNSLVLSVLSVATFALAGAIEWRAGLLMMTAATVGGYMGARWSRRLPVSKIRALVIATGLGMSAVFFWRG